MTPFDRFAQFLADFSFSFWDLVKILFLLGLLIYVAFAVIVIRQVNFMLKALNVQLESFLRVVSWLHLCVAIGLLFLAIVIL